MRLRRLIWLLVAALLAWACDVHEFPNGDNNATITVKLTYDESMEEFRRIEFESKSLADEYASGAPYQMRTVVKLYKKELDGYAREPFWSTEYLGGDISTMERSFSLTMEPVRFRALVWTDFVRTDGGQDFFSLENFPEVRMVNDETGGTDFKSSFAAKDDIQLDTVNTAGSSIVHEVKMERTSAKIRFLATDVDDYMTKVVNLRSGVSAPSDPADAPTPRDFNIDKYKLKVTYKGYVPDTWNVRESNASDANLGHAFTSTATILADKTIYLGCDYIITDRETSVDMMIEIFDDEGLLITRIPNLNVPITRGKITNVTGRLLTHGVSGAVVIDNHYDGEYNIYL